MTHVRKQAAQQSLQKPRTKGEEEQITLKNHQLLVSQGVTDY